MSPRLHGRASRVVHSSGAVARVEHGRAAPSESPHRDASVAPYCGPRTADDWEAELRGMLDSDEDDTRELVEALARELPR